MEKFLATARAYLPLARPYLPHGAALLFVAFLGWGNGYFQARKAVDNPHLKETWSLPAWRPSHIGPEKDKWTELEIWDGQKSRAAAAAAPVAQNSKAWRLVGTVRSGRTYAAVVQLNTEGKVQRFMAGDVLPNGEKVTGVSHGTLQIENNGDRQDIKLFQPDNQQEKK
jgi:hypothetical protein